MEINDAPTNEVLDGDSTTDIDQLVEAIDEEYALGKGSDILDRRLREAHANGELLSTGVREWRGEIIGNPTYANELYLRHYVLNKANEVACAIYASFAGQRTMLRNLIPRLEEDGAFLEENSMEHCESILTDPHWVVAHAGGRIRDPATMEWRDFRFVSDMQVQFTADDPQAPLVTDIPHPDSSRAVFHDYDKESAMRIALDIHRNHAIAACITNVGVHPIEYRRHGFGSLARQTIVRYIREQINPHRDNPIHYLVANMFRITGLRVPSLAPKSFLSIRKPILNKVSILMHALSRKFNAIYAWRIRGGDIPVEIPREEKPPIEAELVLDWETVVMSIDTQK